MFEGQPKGLYALALANTGERFGYYTMLAVFVLFLQENFGWAPDVAGTVYSTFLMFVYFLPFVGGIMADKYGYGKMVTIGITIMFLGYVLLAVPLGNGTVAISAMVGALTLICCGTGLFKGNLQVMVGDLYNSPELADKRDGAFSIFYMAINIGALFAPTAAVKIMAYAEQSLGFAKADAYHFAFAVACISLVVSMLIYFAARSTFRHVEGGDVKKTATKAAEAPVQELSASDTKARIVALCLVFAVVIFFWMAFHQNGLTLTYFAAEFTAHSSQGVASMAFDVRNLVLIILAVYGCFSVFQSKTTQGKLIGTIVVLLSAAGFVYMGQHIPETTKVEAPIFQQFNPFYVVALTPVSVALFGWLGRKGKEPSAPRKIAYGMLVAAVGFVFMIVASMGIEPLEKQVAQKFEMEAVGKLKKEVVDLQTKIKVKENPTTDVAVFKAEADKAKAAIDEEVKAKKAVVEAQIEKEGMRVSPNWLILTYLILTFAELLLSPMGISFVSKVAPPKYKGMMMGGWFVATALGNFLTVVPALLWCKVPLTIVWGTLVVLCVLSFVFIFSQMKRLESVA